MLATGFNLWDVNFPAIEVIGREGRNLGKWWREQGYQAYEGVSVPQFPNFITLNSPYSYSGLSYFMTIEVQMRHLERLFGELEGRDADTFEISQRANDEFLERMLARMDDTVFNLGSCETSRSYYYTNEGDAVILRPTSSRTARKAVESFPIERLRVRVRPGSPGVTRSAGPRSTSASPRRPRRSASPRGRTRS